MQYSSNQLRDYSMLFSRSEVNRWFKEDFESINKKLQRNRLIEKNKGKSYLNVIKWTYRVLQENYPNEYILKNEFLNQWLKKEIGSNDSIIFNEFKLGKAIADLAMFNGRSKVFEIKSILDKEYRLSKQLQEYKKLFNEVYIIIPKLQIEKYIEFDAGIGIITYDSTANEFDLVRNSKYYNSINVDVLMEVLHSNEYLNLANEYFGNIPNMNAYNQFDICKSLFSSIPKPILNELFIRKMKARKIHNSFFNKLNREFNQICLSLNLDNSERENLILKLKSNTV